MSLPFTKSRPYTGGMPGPIAQAEIDRLLEKVVVELEAAFAQQGQVNFFLARHAGGIAGLFDRPDLCARLEAVIANLTTADVFSGAITNLDQRDIDPTRLRRFDSSQKMALQHPLCDHDQLCTQMKAGLDPHVQFCLQGDIQGAVRAAQSKVALEDIGCTLAALGHFEQAIAFIDAQTVEDTAKATVRFIILLEKCRRGDADCIQAVHKAQLHGEGHLNVILALAGRLPWLGYPYSDW